MKRPALLAIFSMTPRGGQAFGPRKTGLSRAACTLLLGLTLATACVADTPPTSAPPAFELVVSTEDKSTRLWLEQHLALQRYASLNDLDDTELSRLLLDADVQVRDLLATLGFFNPQIAWTQTPAEGATAARRVHLSVVTGPVARIAQVQWQWQGDIAQNEQALTQKQEIVQGWTLPEGEPFTQADWTRAKTQALRQLLAQRYPWGRMVDSQALVDATSNQVQLSLSFDSGPSVLLGPTNISGTTHYGSEQVQRLARLPLGTLYSQSALLEAQQRLVTSGFYDSVFVSLDSEGPAQAAPVKIELKEAMRQKWVLGVGVRSDSGARLTAEHTHHQVPGLGWRSVSKLAWDKQLQSAGLDLLAPPDSSLWRWNTSLKLEQEKLTGFLVNSQRWRAGRTQLGERIDRSYYAQYDAAEINLDGLGGQQESISGNYAWTWRNFDSLPFPNQGLGWGVELGAGFTLGNQKIPYVRWLSKGLFLQPLGDKAGRLSLRAELGGVVSKNSNELPSTQLFLAGGDHSVRGYAPGSIGIEQANGLVLAGRYLATGSLEWQRPITVNHQRSEWESAVFIDAGTVTNATQQLKARVGMGVGARWRSPVGPVRIDLAYGQSVHKLRLHMNVGFTF